MKPILTGFLLLVHLTLLAQVGSSTENIFIITTDGFRWQEVFTGADPDLMGNPSFVKDTALTRQRYWDEDVLSRRAKLMPFFWSVIAAKGQLYGCLLYTSDAADE